MMEYTLRKRYTSPNLLVLLVRIALRLCIILFAMFAFVSSTYAQDEHGIEKCLEQENSVWSSCFDIAKQGDKIASLNSVSDAENEVLEDWNSKNFGSEINEINVMAPFFTNIWAPSQYEVMLNGGLNN